MSDAKHTPGPWRALCLKKYTRVMRDSQGKGDETGGVQICHIAGPEEDDIREWNGERWEADARLMAASPEMVDALNGMVGLIQLLCARPDVSADFVTMAQNNHRVEAARTAIAKATQGAT